MNCKKNIWVLFPFVVTSGLIYTGAPFVRSSGCPDVESMISKIS